MVSRKRVLVVEDERPIAEPLADALRREGFEVELAGTAAEGLDAFSAREREPDIVLLDVMLPGLSGWDVATALAERPETRAIPVIFLSARSDHADLVRGQEHGAVGYVTKPFDPVGIAELVERTLQRVARGEEEQLRAEITDGE